MFLVAVEMEDALDEVLGEHGRVPLQQDMHHTVLCKPGEEKKEMITAKSPKATPEACRALKAGGWFPSAKSPSILHFIFAQLTDFHPFLRGTDISSSTALLIFMAIRAN